MSDDAKVKRVKRPNLPRSEAMYHGLRRAIIERALKPGDKLPEDVIGERFGVSRTIVRSVLGRLNSEGLVDLIPNRGATVAQPTLEEAYDIFEVRRSLERDVVRRLVSKITKADVEQLKAHVAREEAVKAANTAESIRLAGEFHILLAEMAGNAVTARYINELVSRCSLILALYGRPHSSDCAVNEHLEIVAALQKGDSEKALETMDHHLEAVTERALLSAPVTQHDIRAILDEYAKA